MMKFKSFGKAAIMVAILTSILPSKIAQAQEKQKGYFYHTIKENETLSSIAETQGKYGIDYFDLYNANKDKITSPDKIKAGQKILIPLRKKVDIVYLISTINKYLHGKPVSNLVSPEEIAAFMLAESGGDPFAINIGVRGEASYGLSQLNKKAIDDLTKNHPDAKKNYDVYTTEDSVRGCVEFLDLIFRRELENSNYIITPEWVFLTYNTGKGNADFIRNKLEKTGTSLEKIIKEYETQNRGKSLVPEVTIKLLLRQEYYLERILNR